MPRALNPKCAACCKLSRPEAIARHGGECWDAQRCDDRRYKYRWRGQRNEARKQQRLAQQQLQLSVCSPSPSGTAERAVSPSVVTLSALSPDFPQLDIPETTLTVATPHAYVHWYRQSKDAPLHAIGVALWVGDHPRAKGCFHITGGGSVQVKAMLRHALDDFSALIGQRVPHYRGEVELMPDLCPLRPCPLFP